MHVLTRLGPTYDITLYPTMLHVDNLTLEVHGMLSSHERLLLPQSTMRNIDIMAPSVKDTNHQNYGNNHDGGNNYRGGSG